MDALFHGKSHLEMDDDFNGVPPWPWKLPYDLMYIDYVNQCESCEDMKISRSPEFEIDRLYFSFPF